MKVSFIIPVFKVEPYINHCVESILCQTYSDYEIILVDDGSPDNCPIMCDDWAAKDARVISLHKPNGGLSDARNFGLEHASGEYVVFVDSDDFWKDCHNLEHLMEIAGANPSADFIGINGYYYYPDTNSFSPWARYVNELADLHSTSEAICLLTKTSSFVMSACFKLIKRHVLIDNKVFFIKGQLSEDIPWFINLLDVSNNCLFVNEYAYAYRQGVSGSITHNIGLRNIDCLIDIIENEIKLIPYRTFTQGAKDCIYSFLAYEYSIILGYLLYLDKQTAKEKYKYLMQYKWLLKYTQDPKVKAVAFANRFLGLRLTTRLLQYRIKRMYA